MRITQKDKALLFELERDCRQSLSTLAKKLKSQKTAIAYRIKRLENAGVIKGYITLLDTFKLGYESFRIYFKLQNISPEKKKELIATATSDARVYFVAEAEGSIDINISLWVKNTKELYQFIHTFLDTYKFYVQSYTVAPYEYIVYGSAYLTGKVEKEKWESAKGEKVIIDNQDKKLLMHLSKNAKCSLVELAGVLNLSANAIKYRLKHLIQNKIILSFRIDMDIAQLGMRWYKLDLQLNNYSERNKILSYLEANPHLFAIDQSLGWADVEAELYYANGEELQAYIDELLTRFPSVRQHSIFTYSKIHKFEFMPTS